MKRSFWILTISLLISLLTGCSGSKTSSGEIWKDTKVPQLIDKQRQLENKTMTVGLYICLFRIQTNKLVELGEQINLIDSLPVRYSDHDAFSANGFTACAGDGTSWPLIDRILEQSQPQAKKRINLLVAENLSEDVVIAELPSPVSVVYKAGKGTAGIGFDSGQMVLRIKAEPLIGLRQVCRLNVTPVFVSGPIQKIKKQPASQTDSEFVFESAAFNAHLQPGQFILLAPAQIKSDPAVIPTPADLAFYSQNFPNTADLYLIVCSMINSPL